MVEVTSLDTYDRWNLVNWPEGTQAGLTRPAIFNSLGNLKEKIGKMIQKSIF